jgi:ubiquinone/menaquinone biosynthesis C-methylase UbiE
MKSQIKGLTKRFLPTVAVATFRRTLLELDKLRTKRIFANAQQIPSYLDIDELESLQRKYPMLPEYGYDAQSIEDRGIARAAQILALPGVRAATSFLELGCWDGMVSCILCRKGKIATAIDNRDEGFDERASREGVRFVKMDADNMQFEDEGFDFVFSYDAFEHFAQPERVLREAIRVVREGGYIYLNFGPLYCSPFGEHAYRSITVPYCQFLFPKNVINEFTQKNGLEAIAFDYVNGLFVEQYNDLWKRYSRVLQTVRYLEHIDLTHLNLIRAYPSCFKSKSECFENFIVGSIEVLFQKTGSRSPNNGG